jgi:hypothetical protein
MDTKPFLTLHQSQIREIASQIEVGDDAPRAADPRLHSAAISACRNAGIEIPKRGYFTIHELDQAIAAAFDKAMPTTLGKRMEFKAKLNAGGLIAEPSPINKEIVVRAGLMLKKAGIPAPDGRPYTVAEFDRLMAGKAHISIPHRLEIKSACLAAGIIDSGVVAKPSVQPQAIEAARQIVNTLGLEYPTGGKKLTVGEVDAAMDSKDWNTQRTISAKNTLATAGVL